ncbi:glycosyltransferase family 4 protein [bacterium]|nr:glycosyltransferase family 4 protein [bacterium]
MNIWKRQTLSFGFVSTRFAGTDGVSLETKKWVDVLTENGCKVYYMAGELDTPSEISFEVPKAHFLHPEILEIHNTLFTKKNRDREITRQVYRLKEEIRDKLEEFHNRFRFDILVVENALAIPVNIPFGQALTEFIIEKRIPTIAHHHDFYWERQRFHSYAAMDYLRSFFPPQQPNIQHVVINSIAGSQLSRRTGAPWTVIPNVMDFKTMPQEIDEYNRDIRKELEVSEKCNLILQPTRLISRKGIETSIELVSRLEWPDCALVIPHAAGDEGFDYQHRVEDYARYMNVKLRIFTDRIAKERYTDDKGVKHYTLWDIYPHADLISYPSLYEGYGNAFVEAIYFKKPVLVNRYKIFEADIEPLGFKVTSFDGFLKKSTIDSIIALLQNRDELAQMAESNYMLGWRYLSYEMLEEKLEGLLTNIYGS